MQAVILAAGMGRRLDPLTRTIPKCLVEINGVPIIVNALNMLTRHKLTRIVIVVGHMAGLVKKRIGKKWNGVPVHYILNPDYDKTNNIYSFWLAKKKFNQDTILMECDVFFEARVIKKLFEKPTRNVALIDEFKPYMDGTVVKITPEKKIDRLIPARDQDEDFQYKDKYKTTNIYSFTKEYLRDVFLPGLEFYIKRQGRNQYYELILGALIYLGDIKIEAVSVEGGKWVEIDDFVDLERAEILFSKRPQLFDKVNRIYGGYWRYDFLDFSYLYNMHFPVSQLINELKANLSGLIRNYPSGSDEIHQKLSYWLKTDAKYLAIGNGASEIITACKHALVGKMTLMLPTFNEYETHLRPEQLNAVVCGKEDFSFEPGRFIDAVNTSGSNAALIINPGIPTSSFIKPKDVKYVLKRLSHLDIVILDESFIDFVSCDENNSLLKDLERFPNLLIVRSLSKDVGVPGLRLGYAASTNAGIIRIIRDALPIWNINALAQHFLSILPKYRREYEQACRKVMEDRDYFYKRLLSVKGITPFAPSANFIFARLEDSLKSDVLKKHLFVHSNILIKDCGNKRGLENNKYVRFSVRTKEEINYFIPQLQSAITALKKWSPTGKAPVVFCEGG